MQNNDTQKPEQADSKKVLFDNYNSFVQEFSKETDRAAVILGAAKLDILLSQILQRTLLPCVGHRDELLDNDAPLGTFGSRIQMCFRLGLIDSELTRALNLIRKIRNEFAHETSAVNLSSGSYRDRIRDLTAPMRGFDAFERFTNQSQFSHVSAAAKDFRAALALVCARLEGAVDTVQPFPTERVRGLIPNSWLREKEKKEK